MGGEGDEKGGENQAQLTHAPMIGSGVSAGDRLLCPPAHKGLDVLEQRDGRDSVRCLCCGRIGEPFGAMSTPRSPYVNETAGAGPPVGVQARVAARLERGEARA